MNAPGSARSDWSILRALSEFVDPKKPLPYDTVEELRSKRFEEFGITKDAGLIPPCNTETVRNHLKSKITESKTITTENIPFNTVNIPDFYLTDAISRASATMAKCSLAFTSGTAKTSGEVDEKFKEILKSNGH